MDKVIPESLTRSLHSIFNLGAENASLALSRWIHQPVRLTIQAVEVTELSEATSLLGNEDQLLAVCSMELTGRLPGELILVFEDRAGLSLIDYLLGHPPGTTTEWGELEQSAALETTNIVGCAFLNSLAAHLPADSHSPEQDLLPSPPSFRHEFAGSLLEFALLDQAMQSDRILLVRSGFATDREELAWWLLFVPSSSTLDTLSSLIPPSVG